ncbi:uncharacterized protein V1516DRAFT_670890 [Lipomyces oligophaga]|uniref:uncharacterized protein n=1 Tax=Lipomyces oligophaga TaxID=45792 RepID=UPI0034CFEFAE
MDLVSRIDRLKRQSAFNFDADLFIEMLTCLLSRRHGIVTVERDVYLDFVEQMISLIGSNIFGFSTRTVVCSHTMTTEQFSDEILLPVEFTHGAFSPLPASSADLEPSLSWNGFPKSLFNEPKIVPRDSNSGSRRLPNLVVIRDLSESSNYVQAQLLEILRTKKLVFSKGIFIPPPQFLVIPLISKDSLQRHLFPYLVDHFFISHNYNASNANMKNAEFGRWQPPVRLPAATLEVLFSSEDIDALMVLSNKVKINADINRYMRDILVFLRMHRAIRGGIPARAIKDFELLVRCLCPLHGITYATPSIVSIATRKTFTHRIAIPLPEDERSVAYGSQLDAVEKFLSYWTPDLVLDDIIDTVAAPV